MVRAERLARVGVIERAKHEAARFVSGVKRMWPGAVGHGLESEQVHARVESEVSHRQQYAVVFGLYGKAAMTRAAVAGPARAAKDVVALRTAPARREADTAQMSARAQGKQPIDARRVRRQEASSSSDERRAVAMSGGEADGARAMRNEQQLSGEEVGETDVGQERGRRREQELVFSGAALIHLHAFLDGGRASDVMAAGRVREPVGGKRRERDVSAERAQRQGEWREADRSGGGGDEHGSAGQRWTEPSELPRRADDGARERDEDGGSGEREHYSSPRREDDGVGAQRGEQSSGEGRFILCANDGQSRTKRPIAATVSKNVATVSKDKKDNANGIEIDFGGPARRQRMGSDEDASTGTATETGRAGKRRVVSTVTVGNHVGDALSGRIEAEAGRTNRRRRVQSDDDV